MYRRHKIIKSVPLRRDFINAERWKMYLPVGTFAEASLFAVFVETDIDLFNVIITFGPKFRGQHARRHRVHVTLGKEYILARFFQHYNVVFFFFFNLKLEFAHKHNYLIKTRRAERYYNNHCIRKDIRLNCNWNLVTCGLGLSWSFFWTIVLTDSVVPTHSVVIKA